MINRVLVTFHLSAAERATLRALAGANQSEYLRGLIAADAARRGVAWPAETTDTRGKYERHA